MIHQAYEVHQAEMFCLFILQISPRLKAATAALEEMQGQILAWRRHEPQAVEVRWHFNAYGWLRHQVSIKQKYHDLQLRHVIKYSRPDCLSRNIWSVLPYKKL